MGDQDILLLSHLSAPLHFKQDVSFYPCLWRRITFRRLRSPNAVVWSTNAVICCTTSDVCSTNHILCCTNADVRGPKRADVRSPSAANGAAAYCADAAGGIDCHGDSDAS